jgi:hypothetical protein
MALKITKQQRDELKASHGQPVPVEDEEGRKLYYLVDADYLHASHAQLKGLIEDAINSRHIPAADAERELRRYADHVAGKQE